MAGVLSGLLQNASRSAKLSTVIDTYPMKRLIAALILSSFLAFGALHAAMGAGFAHAAHGSMGQGFSCMVASCPATESGQMPVVDCLTHCLSAASSQPSSSPILPLLFAVALALFVVARGLLLPIIEDRVRQFTDAIGLLLLRQRLATVVLRN